eukprot:TRINITY_DN399_c0_g1_i11.p2 TRINITY_DN399_c0_g1~~TRINITY_DN399_c0_g1_i11.p2  ORF type:complete len:112 (-),score=56.49 TRINITY_DN399_c0_g1_i11:52-387(-)
MIRRPPRSTQSRSSAASDVYKRQLLSYYFALHQFNKSMLILNKIKRNQWCYLFKAQTPPSFNQGFFFNNSSSSQRPNSSLIPVSYTHLRAHETGRNLVCRLLLEKKKKQQQ